MKSFTIQIQRLIAILLAFAIITTVGFVAIPLAASADQQEKVTHIKTSFEAGDITMLESKKDGNQIKNVGSVADVGRMTGDVTHLVRSDTLSGTPDFKSEEGKHNLFDYNTGSKFLTGTKPTKESPVEIILQLERSSKVVAYLLASGNDEPGRDPASWSFSGSKDGNTWVSLDIQSGITFSSRQEKKVFEFNNTTAYQYYKITITENKGAAMTQFSELQLADSKQAGEGSDITGLVNLDTISGSEDFAPVESKQKLFDHDTYSKFLTGKKPTTNDFVTVSFQMKQPIAVGCYLMGAGPDELGRNPKAWKFEGSMDGKSWDTLDRQSGVIFQKEQETRRFTFDNETEYSYYRIVITENNGAPMTQFSELQLFAVSKDAEVTPDPIIKEAPSFNLTSLVQLDSVGGTPEVGEGESKSKLFDFNTDSKFVTLTKPSSESPVNVSFQLAKVCKATGYTIVSGNDENGRDPASWFLYGSSDGEDWHVIDKQENITFENRKQLKSFELTKAVEYQYFKLSINENMGDAVTQFSELRLTGILPGCATPYILKESILGSEDVSSGEGKLKLFDYNSESKFLTKMNPTTENPVKVIFELEEPFAIDGYIIGSGSDESKRDPKDWKLYGSDDGEQWISIDQRENELFQQRQEQRSFFFGNISPYRFYKLEISKVNGDEYTQFSELHLLGSLYKEPSVEYSPMKTRKSRGPAASFNTLTSTGWTGWSALEVLGKHVGNDEAYCYNVIYDDLSIPVNEQTNLSYVFFPALYNPNEYDYEYTSQHMAVDLKFTDGSYLSELSARDQNGTIVSPMEQGQSGILAYMQWNHIYSNIGTVAKGKTIEQILIGYHKDGNPLEDDAVFLGYFDDIVIEDVPPVEYEHLSDYVNILRGTNNSLVYSRGITTPLVTMPHGFNAFAPMTEEKSTLPYYYQLAGTKNKLRHMGVTHAASPWLGDWGTWQFMPNTNIDYNNVTKGEDISGDKRAAEFTHEKEEAKAHYYSVTFEEGSAASDVKMEVTPTSHGMYSKFSFPAESENRNLIFDCEWANGGLIFHGDGSFTAYSDHIYGHGEYSAGRANGATRMYVYGVIDQNYDAAKVVNSKQGIITFGEGTNTVTMKLATSFISEEQAKKNLSLEISNSDTFDTIFNKAQKTWDDQLGIIEVEGASHDQLVTLYSSMYRMFAYPTLYAENIGTAANEKWAYSSPYSGSLTSPVVKTGKLYTINGFWDTYRSAWPAYALLTPTMSGEMLNGLIEHYKDSGWVSRWLAPGAINCMLGTHADAIFGDAMAKGIEFDYESAFAASLKNSAVVSENLDKGGRIQTASDIFKGYTSTAVHEGFSWGMEDTINDFSISKMAEILGKTDEAIYYKNRALNYVNYYNKDLGWYMARNDDGSFRYNDINNFDPSAWHEKANWDYSESNAWNMSFSAVQDVKGMINLYGGKDKALERLDNLFGADLRGEHVGMQEMREVRLGQYNHTNEPSLHLTYMYSYLGQPYKTQELVRSVMSRCYSGSSIGQGYLGDEDNGEMSAWYVMNALGFYTPSIGNPEYVIGSPMFKKATVHLESGKDLVINAPDNSRENVYIQSVKWNGNSHNKVYFTHDELSGGGTIDFEMGNTPSSWGTEANAQPTSLTVNESEPAPLTDITIPNMKTGIAIDNTSASVASKNTSDLSKLIDNTSDTIVTLTGSEKGILFYSPQAKTISMYTLTSADKSKAPSGFTLYGSTDGIKWTELDNRSGEVFQWNKYTRPFAVDEAKQKAYTYHKLSFVNTTDIQLAEIELIGQDEQQTPLPTLVLNPESLTLEVNGTGQLNVTVTPVDSGTVVWSSSASDIVSVDQNGLVTAKKAGSAIITASLAEDSSIKDTCIVTVKDPDIPVDKSALQELYDTNKDKQKGNYTDNSWSNFQSALNAAKDILDSTSATQSDVDAALQNLYSVIKGLKEKEPISTDKSALQELYDSNKEKLKGNHTDDSWLNYQSALNAAKDILNSTTATQSDIDTALQNLQSALHDLKEQADSSDYSGASNPSSIVGESSKKPISQGNNDSPDTGDRLPIIPVVLLMILSAGCVYLTKHRYNS